MGCLVYELLYAFVELFFYLSSSVYVDSEFGSTLKTSSNMKNVHIALGILTEYREWCLLLSPICWEKNGLSPKEKIKQNKAKALAWSISVAEPAAS